MGIPNTYTSVNETGCCAIPDVDEWRDREVIFDQKPFIRMYTRSLWHIPLNMSGIMTKLQKTATDAGATMPAEQAMVLSRELSPWKAEQLYAVSQPVQGADNITLSGNFLSKVFEGPYKNAESWYETLQEYSKSKGRTANTIYFFYTTCPKCAEHYGKNYVIGLADISQ
jgi:hypothetical protein